ncbi:hypothetical protein Bca4012_092897 [Brassica carinata]
MSDCLNAQLCRDGPACISVFGNLAELLDEELVMSGVEPKVAVATNINPKLVGGSSSTSTKYGGVKKIETLTLSELNAYITSPPHYCNEESKMIVVYEYMKKGMLKDHLFRKSHYTLRVKYTSESEFDRMGDDVGEEREDRKVMDHFLDGTAKLQEVQGEDYKASIVDVYPEALNDVV